MDQEDLLREAAEDHLLREAHRRRFLYSDVEELIESDFLSHTVTMGSSSITFRTLLPEDQVRFLARSRGKTDDVLRWTLASSVWMIDGFEVPLAPDQNGAYHIYQTWASKLSLPWVDALLGSLIGLRNRVGRALKIVESYCYEPYSRGSWRMKGRPVGGLENANVVRRIWVAHNLSEDSLLEERRQWQHTRAIISSMSQKGGKEIGKSLDKEADREENRRRRVIEEAVNWIIRGDPEDQEPLTVTVNGQRVVVPKIHSAQTTKDLEEEMRRVFRGEKDFHDMLVDQYHEGIRKRVVQEREDRKQAILASRKRAEEAEQAMGVAPPLVGYTKEQLQKLNPRILETKTTSAIPEGAQSNYMFDRYFEPNLRPGVLTPTLKVTDPDYEDQRTYRKEEEKEGGSLQDRVAARRPILDTGTDR